MAQLLVRKVEDAVVARLRAEAARDKISVEEAHRRVLRRVLLPEPGEKKTLWDHLTGMPLPEKYDGLFDDIPRGPERPIPNLED